MRVSRKVDKLWGSELEQIGRIVSRTREEEAHVGK
jgi:hypothetical protein